MGILDDIDPASIVPSKRPLAKRIRAHVAIRCGCGKPAHWRLADGQDYICKACVARHLVTGIVPDTSPEDEAFDAVCAHLKTVYAACDVAVDGDLRVRVNAGVDGYARWMTVTYDGVWRVLWRRDYPRSGDFAYADSATLLDVVKAVCVKMGDA